MYLKTKPQRIPLKHTIKKQIALSKRPSVTVNRVRMQETLGITIIGKKNQRRHESLTKEQETRDNK